ncbi:hypothetical protein EV363DRAFT_1295842 [Boletus edulis]|nr:hypothetical protein EV363DRAFT_1295842 [Boletus edulis]
MASRQGAVPLRCSICWSLLRGTYLERIEVHTRVHSAHATCNGAANDAAFELVEVIACMCRNQGGFRLSRVTQGTPLPLEIYTPSTDTWSTVYPPPIPNTASGARSLVVFVTRTNTTPQRILVALLHHSERDASSVGHAGAGIFWDDAWLLVVTSTSTLSLEWKKLRVEGTHLPQHRGWFPASYVRDGKPRVVRMFNLVIAMAGEDRATWAVDGFLDREAMDSLERTTGLNNVNK